MDDVVEANYRSLRAHMRERGMYRRLYGYYALYGLLVTTGIFVSLYVVTATSNIYLQLLNALFLGFVTVQAGMLGHDLAHNQVFSSKSANYFFGVIIWGLYAGMSMSDWYYIHNTHHEHPNQLDHDPDIDIPFFFADAQVPRQPGTLLSYVLPYQHILFFLVLPVLYVSKLIATWKRTVRRFSFSHIPELLLALSHFLIMFYMTFTFLPVGVALSFLAMYAVTVGLYMSFVFAPNHKGEEMVGAHENVSWMHQITTTRNLFPSFFIFHLFGGLNYQIEHHLFPNMARPLYQEAQPLVKKFCDENGIPYHETTWFGSMREIYLALKEQAYKFRARPSTI